MPNNDDDDILHAQHTFMPTKVGTILYCQHFVSLELTVIYSSTRRSAKIVSTFRHPVKTELSNCAYRKREYVW